MEAPRTIRCFVALWPELDACSQLSEGVAAMRRDPAWGEIRWVASDRLHLTLLFCGELEEALARAAFARIASQGIPPFDLTVAGMSCFPSNAHARVLAANVAGDDEGLGHARRAVVRAFEGVSAAEREFAPHITLARWGRPHSLPTQLLERWGAQVRAEWRVERIALVRSVAGRYSTLAETRLAERS